MRTFLIFTISLCTSLQVFATAQFPDEIIYQGEKYSLHSNFLAPYFKKYPEKRPESDTRSTALYRGYIATFKIIDNQLFLTDIRIQIPGLKFSSVMSEVFPGNEPVKVDWVTGLFEVPYGKLVKYVHMGYGSTYENYIIIELKNGILTDAKRFTIGQYKCFKKKQFKAFRKTNEYKELKKEKKEKYGYSNYRFNLFLRRDIIHYSPTILTDD